MLLLLLLLLLELQLCCSLPGFRLAHAYNFFYTVHEVYDAAAAVMATLVEGLVPLPTAGQATCRFVFVYLCIYAYMYLSLS
jgi:hypothetical protein